MPGIKMIPVKSSNVASIGYDEKTRTLRVEFLSGREYDYGAVRPEEWEGLKESASVGKYLHAEIIGKHVSEKVQKNQEKPGEEKAI